MPSHTKYLFASSANCHHPERISCNITQELETPTCGLATTGECCYTLVLKAFSSAVNFSLMSFSHVLGQQVWETLRLSLPPFAWFMGWLWHVTGNKNTFGQVVKYTWSKNNVLERLLSMQQLNAMMNEDTQYFSVLILWLTGWLLKPSRPTTANVIPIFSNCHWTVSQAFPKTML